MVIGILDFYAVGLDHNVDGLQHDDDELLHDADRNSSIEDSATMLVTNIITPNSISPRSIKFSTVSPECMYQLCTRAKTNKAKSFVQRT